MNKQIEQFELIQKIGEGHFGKAYKALDTISGHYVCLKTFKDCSEESRQSYTAEVRAGQEGMNHQNVIKILAAGIGILTENDLHSETYYIVSELCENGELFDFVKDSKGLEENTAR